MPKTETEPKKSLKDRMKEFQESQAKRETFTFPKDESIFVQIDSVKEQSFSKSKREWISIVYRATKYDFKEDGEVKSETPVVFFGNTVLDGEVSEGHSYLITYLGKTRDYHDYMIVETTLQDIRNLASPA